MGLDIAQERAAAAEKKRKADKDAEKLTEKQKQLKYQEEIDNINRNIILPKHDEVRNTGPIIDCSACKTAASMSPTEVPRFGEFIRFLGYLIVTPSVLGFAFSILVVFGVGKANSDLAGRFAEPGFHAGVAIGSTIGVLGALFFGAVSLVGGLVGYLLLTKRKVFRCRVCGFILERA